MNCILKNLFGKPNEGLHSYRLNDVAIVDYVLTIQRIFNRGFK